MPSLSPADREQLLGPCGPCPKCKGLRVRHYCRSCDEFYETCWCETWEPTLTTIVQHAGHRLYRWTPEGVRAEPDFDRGGEA